MKKLLKILLISSLCFCYVFKSSYAEVRPALTSCQESFNLSDLVDNFKNYTTTNTSFHAGNLYEHSIWVALIINKWFENKESWVKGLDQKDKKLALLAGLLHDVGKAGDLDFNFYTKPEHPESGMEYILGKKTFYLSKNCIFNFDKFFKQIGLNKQDKKLLSIFVGAHSMFGELLRLLPKELTSNDTSVQSNAPIKNFMQKIKTLLNVAKYKGNLDKKLLNLIILICVADVKGSNYIELNSPINIFDYTIKSSPAIVHPDAKDNFTRFEYGTRGKTIRKLLNR